MRLAVVTAFGAEYQAIWSRLTNHEVITKRDEDGYAVTKGLLEQVPVHLVVTGMGRAAIEKHCSAFLARFSPTHVLSLGFCGGLSHSAKIGMISIPDGVMNLEGASLSPTLNLRQRVAKKFYDSERDFLIGDMVTMDKIIERAEERKSINADTGAVTVDMESYYIANLDKNKKLSWFNMKSVMDDLGTKSFKREDLMPGLEIAKKSLFDFLPDLMAELRSEWQL